MIDQEIWNVFYHLNPSGGPWDYPDGSPDQHVVDFVNYSKIAKSAAALDVGCGYGKNSKFLIERGFNVTGIDIAEYPINKCKEQYPDHTFLKLNFLKNNFADESFDMVIDAGAMHVNHPDCYLDFLKEYHRVLKPDGRFFIRVFNHTQETVAPIFFVFLQMPVYGVTENKFNILVNGLFEIEKTVFDKDYGMHGLGCNYYYLKKK